MKVSTKLKELDFSKIALANSNRNSPSMKSPQTFRKRIISQQLTLTVSRNQSPSGVAIQSGSNTERYKSLNNQDKYKQLQRNNEKINSSRQKVEKQHTKLDGYTLESLDDNHNQGDNNLLINKIRLKSSNIRTATFSSITNNSNTTASNDSPLIRRREPRKKQQAQNINLNSLQDYVDSYDNSPTKYRLYSSIQQNSDTRNLYTSIDFLPSKTPLNQSTSLTRNEQRMNKNHKLPSLDLNKTTKVFKQNSSLTNRKSSASKFNLKKTFHVQSSYQAHMQSCSKKSIPTHNPNATSSSSLHRKSLSNNNSFFGGKDNGRQSIIHMAQEEDQQNKFYQFLGQTILSQNEFNIYLESFKNNATVLSLKHFIDTFSKQERRLNKYFEEITKRVLLSKFDFHSLSKQKERCSKLVEESQRIYDSMAISANTTLERDELNYSKMDKIIYRSILTIKEYTTLFENIISFIDLRIQLQKYIDTILSEFNSKNLILTKKLNQNIIEEISGYEQVWRKILLDFEAEFQHIQSLSTFNVTNLFESLTQEIQQITHTPVKNIQQLLNDFTDSARNFLFRGTILQLSLFLMKPFLMRAKETKQQANQEKKEMIDDVRENYIRFVSSLELYFYEKLSLKSKSEDYQREVLDFGLPSFYLLMETADQTGLKGSQYLQNIASVLIDLKSVYDQFTFSSRFYTLPEDKPFFSKMLIFLETLQNKGINHFTKVFTLLKFELNILPLPISQIRISRFKKQQISTQNLIQISNKIDENSKLKPKNFTNKPPETLLIQSQEFVELFEKDMKMLIEAADPYESDLSKEQQKKDVSYLKDFIEGITFVKPSYEIFLHLYSEYEQYEIQDIFLKLKFNKVDVVQHHNILFENYMYWFLKKKVDFTLFAKSEWEIKKFLKQIVDNHNELQLQDFISGYKMIKKLNRDISKYQQEFQRENYAFIPLINSKETAEKLYEKYIFLNSMFNIIELDSKTYRMPTFGDCQQLLRYLGDYKLEIQIDQFQELFNPIHQMIQSALDQSKALTQQTANSTDSGDLQSFIAKTQALFNNIISSYSNLLMNTKFESRVTLMHQFGEYLSFKRENIALLQSRDTQQIVYILDYSELLQSQEFPQKEITKKCDQNISIDMISKQQNKQTILQKQQTFLQNADLSSLQRQDNKLILKPLQNKQQLYQTSSQLEKQKQGQFCHQIQLNVNSITLQNKFSNKASQNVNIPLVKTIEKEEHSITAFSTIDPNIVSAKKQSQNIELQTYSNQKQIKQNNKALNNPIFVKQIKLQFLQEFNILNSNKNISLPIQNIILKSLSQIKIIEKKSNTLLHTVSNTTENSPKSNETKQLSIKKLNNNIQNDKILRFSLKSPQIFIQFDSPFQDYELTILEEETQNEVCKKKDCQTGLSLVEIEMEKTYSKFILLLYKSQPHDEFDRIHIKETIAAYSFLPNYLDISSVPLNFKQHEYINIFFVCRQPEKLETLLKKENSDFLQFRDSTSQLELSFSQTKLSRDNICYHIPYDAQDKDITITMANISNKPDELKEIELQVYIYMRTEYMKAGKSVTKIELIKSNSSSISQLKPTSQYNLEWQIAQYNASQSSISVLNSLQLIQNL